MSDSRQTTRAGEWHQRIPIPLEFRPLEKTIVDADTQIHVSDRDYKVRGPVVTYKETMEIWNNLHEPVSRNVMAHSGYRLRLRIEESGTVEFADCNPPQGTTPLLRHQRHRVIFNPLASPFKTTR